MMFGSFLKALLEGRRRRLLRQRRWSPNYGPACESLEGRKLLVVQTLNKDLEPNGKPLVAVDSVGAGIGELVFWCRGKEASFPFKREDTPTDCTIIGIVDSDAHVTQG